MKNTRGFPISRQFNLIQVNKPTIRGVEAQKYVVYLEDRLAKFEAKTTITKFYAAVKKQVENISDLFDKVEVTETDLKNKDDKFFDRYFQYLRYSDDIAANIENMEKRIAPDKQGETIKDGASVEQRVFGKDN